MPSKDMLEKEGVVYNAENLEGDKVRVSPDRRAIFPCAAIVGFICVDPEGGDSDNS